MSDPADRPPAIFLMGPTASGKTDLAVALRDMLPCDLVSVDSALVYRGMDIGTAKPDPATLTRAPHRLIDICDPAEAYSAGRFRDDALREMAEITGRGRIPLLVGGTMLYFRTLERGLAHLPRADATVRARLTAEAEAHGWAALHRRLADVDPVTAARVHPNDPQRIQRALEVHELTGRPLSELHAQQAGQGLPYRVLRLALAPEDRTVLHARIARRFEGMLAQGLIEEVAGLRARGDLHPGLPSMRAVGYRQVWDYLEGRYDRAELEKRGVIATRQLAKRQLTWLRADPQVTWFRGDEPDLAARVRNFLAARLP